MYQLFVSRLLKIVIFIGLISTGIIYWLPGLFNLAPIALGLGLRHGLDADHIVAIDNITRKLTLEKKPSHTTGLFFALGHSTIVLCLTVLLILGISRSRSFCASLSNLGDKTGSLISISFLIFTLILNLLAFKTINRPLENCVTPNSQDPRQDLISARDYASYSGLVYKFAYKILFNSIDRPQKMFIVGFFFGLGFDTATEVGLLSLAATSMIHGFSLIFILLLPILFGCGMVFTDSVNSIFMSKMYNWINYNSQKLKLYNYLILSFATIATLIVSIIEIISFVNNYISWPNLINSFILTINNNSELVGISIASGFVILGVTLFLNTFWDKK